jgi:two-component system LytT family response regulator
MRTLIADDERVVRERLRRALTGAADAIVVTECRGGRGTVDTITFHAPDLVFLDVGMPELDGLSVVQAVGPERMPLVVFVTAYDAYALEAFQRRALDYVLKPYDKQRILEALERARAVTALPGGDEVTRRLVDLLRSEGRAGGHAAAALPLPRRRPAPGRAGQIDRRVRGRR